MSARTSPAASAHPSAHPGVLLSAQLVFNVGFYAVVPFLAVVLRDDYLLGGAGIGLVLGARTFAQQGLFLVGGVLADAFGARTLILLGCLVRVAGFGCLALADGLPVFVAGALLTGLGGALFSPALETLVAAAQRERELTGGATHERKATLFALLTVFGETGAVIGPLVGAALFGWGFEVVAASGAGLFLVVTVLLALLLPRRVAEVRPSDPAADVPLVDETLARPSRWASVQDRPFLLFAALHSVNLLAYNQLYLGLPVELERVGAGPVALGVIFAVVSAVTIGLQLPIARRARRSGAAPALRVGYLLIASGFGVLALAAPFDPPPGLTLAPVGVGVLLLTLGHLTVGPTALELVPRFAGDRALGSFYGLLATCGGVAVLVGNVVLGALYDGADTPGPAAVLPWLLLALLPLAPALVVPRLLVALPPVLPPVPVRPHPHRP